MSDKISPSDVHEGDTVFMGISMHGTVDGTDGVEYRDDIHRAGVAGTVVDAPDEDSFAREALTDGGRPMVDFAVRTDDGTKFTWNVDNGYVIGPVDHPDRPSRSDIGKFGGFYPA